MSERQVVLDPSKRPLRRRLFRSMSVMLVGTLLVAVLAFYVFNQYLEDMMLDIIMTEEMSVIKEHLSENPETAFPRASSMRVHMPANVPGEIDGLAAGRHHDIRIGDDRFDVLVDEWRGEPIYLLFNINRLEELEGLLFVMLLVMTLLLTWLSGLASLFIARRLAGPVDRLADRLAGLEPLQTDVSIADDFRGEEVEEIAGAIDHYRERIAGFVERERSFTSSASHELRTPLAVIQGASEILSSLVETPQQRRALARIDRARRDMLEFIDALLSLSREEVDPPFRMEAHVEDVLRQQCHQLRELLEDRPVELACGEPRVVVVDAPPSLVAIVISNLLRNAVAHTREGEIRVSMEDRSVVIEDSGEGIPPEIADRVFERHFSARGGSGMGLYIVRRICDRYGWEVSLAARPGGGTRAVIHF